MYLETQHQACEQTPSHVVVHTQINLIEEWIEGYDVYNEQRLPFLLCYRDVAARRLPKGRRVMDLRRFFWMEKRDSGGKVCCGKVHNYVYKTEAYHARRNDILACRRAGRLLRQVLSTEQLNDLTGYRHFYCLSSETKSLYQVSKSGLILRLRNRATSENDKLNLIAHFCIQPRSLIPMDDVLISIKLMIEFNERRFLKTANRTLLSGHPDYRKQKERQTVRSRRSTRFIQIFSNIKIRRDLMKAYNDVERFILTHLYLSEGVSEVPPWYWENPPDGFIGLYNEWPRGPKSAWDGVLPETCLVPSNNQ